MIKTNESIYIDLKYYEDIFDIQQRSQVDTSYIGDVIRSFYYTQLKNLNTIKLFKEFYLYKSTFDYNENSIKILNDLIIENYPQFVNVMKVMNLLK